MYAENLHDFAHDLLNISVFDACFRRFCVAVTRIADPQLGQRELAQETVSKGLGTYDRDSRALSCFYVAWQLAFHQIHTISCH